MPRPWTECNSVQWTECGTHHLDFPSHGVTEDRWREGLPVSPHGEDMRPFVEAKLTVWPHVALTRTSAHGIEHQDGGARQR